VSEKKKRHIRYRRLADLEREIGNFQTYSGKVNRPRYGVGFNYLGYGHANAFSQETLIVSRRFSFYTD